MSPRINLSKSAFIRGLQCHKSLWLKKYQPGLEDEISDAQQAVFDRGSNVGILAQKLFPGGEDLGRYIPENFGKVFTETKRLMYSGETPIYEAGFSKDNCLCFLDILTKVNGKWHAFEVKGSTSLKDVYLLDTAFQYYVLTSSGVELEDISLIYLNREYVRKGEIDLQQLFVIESVKERVEALQPQIREEVRVMKQMLVRPELPDIDIGRQCTEPYPCSFMGHCWQDVPEYSVFNISRLSPDKKFELYRQRVINITDIPDDYPLSVHQAMQVSSEKTGEAVINKEKIRDFTEGLEYPLYFLDFETFQPAVPMFDESRPYQQIVFQYSLHRLDKADGELHHMEFLAEAKGDPRIPMIEKLIQDLGREGDILVYNQSFEKARLQENARDFPKYKTQIDSILERITDLMEPFSQKHYYTPEMQGSYSIKQVLPALVPGFGYEGLNIAEGSMASIAFESLYHEKDENIVRQTRNDLLAYCHLDTMAMVKLLEKLGEV